MHEVGIARNVIDAALAAVPEVGYLNGITVSIGPLSAVVSGSETAVTSVRYDET